MECRGCSGPGRLRTQVAPPPIVARSASPGRRGRLGSVRPVGGRPRGGGSPNMPGGRPRGAGRGPRVGASTQGDYWWRQVLQKRALWTAGRGAGCGGRGEWRGRSRRRVLSSILPKPRRPGRFRRPGVKSDTAAGGCAAAGEWGAESPRLGRRLPRGNQREPPRGGGGRPWGRRGWEACIDTRMRSRAKGWAVVRPGRGPERVPSGCDGARVGAAGCPARVAGAIRIAASAGGDVRSGY